MSSSTLTSLLLCDPVDRVIRVSLSSHFATDGNSGSLSPDSFSIGIDIGYADLDGGVVFGSNETVCFSVSSKLVSTNRIVVTSVQEMWM